jgi:hypothetical protein
MESSGITYLEQDPIFQFLRTRETGSVVQLLGD